MKEILKAVVEKKFATFETLVKETLHRKAAALVEAYTPVVSAKIIAEADTVVKHTGGEYVFEDGSSAEISREEVKAFVEAVSGSDDYYHLVEVASSSVDIWEEVKKKMSSKDIPESGTFDLDTPKAVAARKAKETPKDVKESVLKSLRPVLYTPTLNETYFKAVGDVMAGVVRNITHPQKVQHKATGAIGRVSDDAASKPNHKVVLWDGGSREEVHEDSIKSLGH